MEPGHSTKRSSKEIMIKRKSSKFRDLVETIEKRLHGTVYAPDQQLVPERNSSKSPPS
jgi:hypothetical protein